MDYVASMAPTSQYLVYKPDAKSVQDVLDKIKSTDVNKAIQRSITKAIARHGLGFYIYAGEDLPETLCDECGEVITGFQDPGTGKLYTAGDVVKMTQAKYKKALCRMCGAKAKAKTMKTEGKE
jgi:hypothetical protein